MTGRADPQIGRLVQLAVIAAAILVGCNPLAAIPTEVDRRPPLPAPEPFPVDVEDVIPRLEAVGLGCQFSPDSDIRGGWHCGRDNLSVNITSQETGPIEFVFSYLSIEAKPEPAVLNAAAAQAFTELVIEPILPEDAQPPVDVLHAVLADNFQMEVGDGYYLVFHRNSVSRSMYLHYSSQN